MDRGGSSHSPGTSLGGWRPKPSFQRSHEALHAAEQVVAIADDRERIARDLHDKVIQRLFAAGLNIQAVVGATDDRVRPRLEATIDALNDAIRKPAWRSSRSRVPERAGGLHGQILDVVSDAVAGLGFDPRLQFDGPVESIGDDVAAQLVPTLREALSNVARHAAAQSVQIVVSVADTVTLEVIDDGVGLPDDPTGAGAGARAGAEGGDVLTVTATAWRISRHRAEELGGTFEIVSVPTGGARLRWCVPLRTTAVNVGTWTATDAWPYRPAPARHND